MLEHKCEFTDLTQESHEEAVSSSLLEFVCVLQNGGDIEFQLESNVTQEANFLETFSEETEKVISHLVLKVKGH